jgi:hypothetical protein
VAEALRAAHEKGIVHRDLLKGDHGSSALFRWRSPKRSERPADLPLGAKLEAKCLYYYSVDGDGVSSYTVAQGDCDQLVVPRPRCTVQQVWSKAEAKGAPRGNYIGDVSYYAWDKHPARWYVRIGSFSEFLQDDC